MTVPALRRSSFEVMGTVASFAARTHTADTFDHMTELVRRELVAADLRFSPYRHDSELTRLRRGEPADPSAQLREVWNACLDLRSRTAGAFRPFDRSGQVDTTGYVKGWAMAQAEAALRGDGRTDWQLAVGGDIVAAGRNGDRPWHVAVRDPNTGSVARVFAIEDAAVATSGEYERGAHIWGAQQSGPRPGSVTVVGPDIAIADALATALWAQDASHPSWLSGFADYGVLWLGVAAASDVPA